METTSKSTTARSEEPDNNHNRQSNNDGSILFQPHRTIGLISSSQPYSLAKEKAKSHLDTFITMPLQERFVIYKCDSLKPVLVSDHLPGTRKMRKDDTVGSDNDEDDDVDLNDSALGNNHSHNVSKKGEKMFHAISDSSLGVTVASHAYKGRWNASHASLYKRTKCIHTRKIIHGQNSDWGIVQVLNLGRSKFPKKQAKHTHDEDPDDVNDNQVTEEGVPQRMENCLVLAVICAKHSLDSNSGIETVGDESDNYEQSTDDESDNTNADSASDDNDDMTKTAHRGEIVILIASRYNLTIQKRIPLTQVPDFTPTASIHPHTYINKILIGSTKGELILLNIRSSKIIHHFKCLKSNSNQSSEVEKINVIEQSPAVDTVAVGTEKGEVHLINIRMDLKLFTLYHDAKVKSYIGRKKRGITSLSFRTDASALDSGIAPLAVGQMNGSISIWDLTPRSDDDSDEEQQYSKDSQRTLLCQMENAHPGGVSHLTYMPQEPLLLSSGVKSNSLVMHIFDNPNHTGRILRQRAGHVAPPEIIRYQHSSNSGVLASMADGTDAASCQILSGGGKGDCSLRSFSTARSVLDREFSQGKGLTKKAQNLDIMKSELYLNEIIGLATSDVRSRDWGDLVTIHKDHAMAYVWSTKRKSQHGPVLRQDGWNVSAMKIQPPKDTHASALAISSCGNFAVVGTKGGTIYKYNIQSGMPRGSFPRDATNQKSNGSRKGNIVGNINRTTKMLERNLKIHKIHEKEKDEAVVKLENKREKHLQSARHQNASVVGLAVDTLNKTLISVGTDSKLILWSFVTHAPHRKSPIYLTAPATKLIHTRDSDLLAIALEDYSVVVFDCSSLTIVRKFGSKESTIRHNAPITDLAFGPDNRKLFTSSMDGSIRVWDVPTSTCVDWMTFASAPTSLALSTTGEFLATSHLGSLGISLWCDKSYFRTVHLGVNPPITPFPMDEPAAVAEDEKRNSIDNGMPLIKNSDVEIIISEENEEVEAKEKKLKANPKMKGLVTLSGLPAAHWKNLFHLELVKERNKPKEAPKKPPSAPFFLQWRSGEPMVPNNIEEENEADGKDEEEEWNAAWSDDEVDEENGVERNFIENSRNNNKRKVTVGGDLSLGSDNKACTLQSKRKKITHTRSRLAALLNECAISSNFQQITDFLSGMGPSSIDVAFSTLCHGLHDLEDGLPLLHLASLWLLQACRSKQNYEVINAYLHRFLYLHSATIAGIDISLRQKEQNKTTFDHLFQTERKELRIQLIATVKELRIVQAEASREMKNKLQKSLCLLRHFSRII